jgi:hypothetical protein
MTADQPSQTHHRRIFDNITPEFAGRVALAAALASAVLVLVGGIVAAAVGTSGRLSFAGVVVCLPLLLLGVILRLPGSLAAWAGAALGILAPALWIAVFVLSLTGPYEPFPPLSAVAAVGVGLVYGIAILIGLAGFVSELPHLRHQEPSENGLLRPG